MYENTDDENAEFLEEAGENESNDEILPNFPFHNLKDDPDLQHAFMPNDDEEADINEHLDRAIASNLETLDFKWQSECLICSENFEDYQDLLQHCIELHSNDDDGNEYACIFEDCVLVLSSEHLLARHLVLRHSDLERIKIYASCPYCGYRSSNFNKFNKHSCYSKLSRKACTQPYCQYCKEEFVSHKRFLFHLQFHLVKRRAKICLICNENFNDVNEFFMHVNYAHESPEKLPCTICDRVFTNLEAFSLDQELHGLPDVYKCDECSKTFRHKRILMQHKENMHSNVEYACDLCPKIFPSFSMLQCHLKYHDPDAEVQVYTCANCGLIGRDCKSLETHIDDPSRECFDSAINKEILVTAYSCHFCAQDFKDKDALQNHHNTGVHEDGKMHCPICMEAFNELKMRRIHMLTHTNYTNWLKSCPLRRLYLCDEDNCEVVCQCRAALQRHKKRFHKTQKCCRKCDQKFENTAELQNHMKQCRHTNAFQCQICAKMCPTKMSLAVHVARRHYVAQISCPHCPYAYKSEEALRKHIEYSHVPVPCTQCDKVIGNRRYLATHMRAVHESECRYFCAYCDKGFFYRSQKVNHEQNCQPDTLYKCGECDFQTKYANSLELHVAKHLQKLQLKCPYCARMFARKNTLTLHVKRHENDKPFRCWDVLVDGCEAAYVTRYLLNQHIKSKHSAQSCKIEKQSRIANKKERNEDEKRIFPKQRKRQNAKATNCSSSSASSSSTTATFSSSSATATKRDLFVLESVDRDQVAETAEINGTTAAIATASAFMMGEEVFIAVADIKSETDENCLMMLVDDNTHQQILNNAQGQLLLLENTELITS